MLLALHNHFVLLLGMKFCCYLILSVLTASLLYLTSGSPLLSIPFHSQSLNFDCPSMPCLTPSLSRAKFHVVAGTDHDSSLPLLVHQVCYVVQRCIERANMVIVLHTQLLPNQTDLPEFNQKSSMIGCQSFLKEQGVPFEVWHDPQFTANSKMLESYRALTPYRSNARLIYQIDMDEIPHVGQLAAAMSEIESGTCDSIMASWSDRLDMNGKLKKPIISEFRNGSYVSPPLQEQYPLRCRISDQFVGGGRTTKTIVYPANYRLDGGHHEIWCDVPTNLTRVIHAAKNVTIYRTASQQESHRLRCIDHIRLRNKGPIGRLILQQLPKQQARPRYCNTVVSLDHFKFTNGLLESLKHVRMMPLRVVLILKL